MARVTPLQDKLRGLVMVLVENTSEVDISWNNGEVSIPSGDASLVDDRLVADLLAIFPFCVAHDVSEKQVMAHDLATNVMQVEDRIEELTNRRTDINKELKDLRASLADLESQVKELDAKIE